MTSNEKKIKRMRERMERNQLREMAFTGQFEISSLFDSCEEIRQMTAPFSIEFRDQYKRAFDLYAMGYWEHAKKEFVKTQKILEEDNQSIQ